MSEFISPYQFVPVTGHVNGKSRPDVEYATVRQGKHPFVRHDLWHRDGHSGRIVCRLHLETPTFVGNDQSRDDETGGLGENGQPAATLVNHFQVEGQPAFPATSLRGMVGSTLEALSQSALRVLDNIDYSVRQDASVGNKLCLGRITADTRSDTVQICEYDYLHVRTAEAEAAFGTLSNLPICYADLRQRRPKPSGRGPDELPSTAIRDHRSATHTEEGFLLILDAPGDRLPSGRKFEIFACLGERAGNAKLSVSTKAIERYQQLFAERWLATANKDDEPAQPFGFKGFERDTAKPWNLLPGQFVYFRAAGNTVTEIRPSQIWRAKAGLGHDYFAAVNPNTLPWGAAARTGGISPAEALFGVVERDKRNGTKGSRNLAGRVCFSAACHLGKNGVRQLAEVTLKILSSPKPPSPAMYFHPKGRRGDYLVRSDLIGHASTPGGTTPHPPTPNGRKVYVHHRPGDIDITNQAPWRSHSDENDHQKLRIKPLDAGQDFFFHIDFDNLACDELDLLLAALKPAPRHQHRLGLGKGLGLGSVSLDVAAVCLRDTTGRYTAEGLTRPRYRFAWREHEDRAWQQRYATEWQACASDDSIGRPAEWRVAANPLIDTATREWVTLLGDPQQVKLPVLPPLLKKQMGTLAAREQETFEWFVENNSTDSKRPPESHQALGRLRAGELLPGLDHDPPGVKLKP